MSLLCFAHDADYVQAGGQSGSHIVEHLLENPQFNVTAITRAGSKSKLPSGVITKSVDYGDPESLTEALKGQQVLIITMAVTAPPDTQAKLFKAAAAANVPWVFPNEWGVDGSFSQQAGDDVMIGKSKREARELVESLGKSSCIYVATGFWYEWSLGGGFWGIDINKRSVLWYGNGKSVRQNTSTWPQVGRGVAKLLALKVLPDDEQDTGATLSQFRNSFVRVSSFTLSQRDMLDAVHKVLGTSDADWTMRSEEPQKVFDDARQRLFSGERSAFSTFLYSRYFYPDQPALFEQAGLLNEVLGLTQEDLGDATKQAVKLAEEEYVAKKYSQSYSDAKQT